LSLNLPIRPIIMFWFCALMCVGITTPLHASDAPLRVLALMAKPFGYTDKGGVARGMVVDWVSAIMKQAQISYEVTVATFPRIRQEMQLGQADVTVLLRSGSTDQVAKCVEAISVVRTVVVGKRGSEFSAIQDLYQLKKPVGGVSGAKYGAEFDEDKKIPRFMTNSYEQGITMLFRNRLSAIVGVENALMKAAHSLGHPRDEFGTPLLINKKEVCLYYSLKKARGSIENRQRLKTVVQELKLDGVLETIQKKWTKQ
jgi:ABC-type amino acid transport substrate-binding protein